MSMSRRHISKALLCSGALAPSSRLRAAPPCDERVSINGMKVRATSEKISIALHQTSEGLWGEEHGTTVNITADDLSSELSISIAVRPASRTFLAEVLAFWEMPKLEGRAAPAQVSIAAANSPVPAELAGNLVGDREIVDWNVDGGAKPLFRAKLPPVLGPFLLAAGAVELKVECCIRGLPGLHRSVCHDGEARLGPRSCSALSNHGHNSATALPGESVLTGGTG